DLGGHSVEETPGSIPNPVAKLDCADGTALGRVWESRSPPDIFVWGVGESLRARVRSFSPLLLPLFFMPKIERAVASLQAAGPGEERAAGPEAETVAPRDPVPDSAWGALRLHSMCPL